MENENQLITKSNHLIQGTLTVMNVKELKLAAVLLAEFHNAYRGNDMCTQTILTRTEFLNFLGLNDSGMNYSFLSKILEDFQQRAVCKWIDDKKANNITPFFKNIKFNTQDDDGNNDIIFTWNDCIIPLVVGLDKNFTKLFKRNILALNSKKAIVLYELMKSYMARSYPVSMKIQELREKLDMQSKYYNCTPYVLKKISEITKEVNESTDIIVSYVKNKNPKDKRKVDSLTFTVKDQAERKVWWEEFPQIKLSDEQYQQVKTWTEPVHFRTLLTQMQELMDKGRHIRNQYKWLCTQHDKLLKKSSKIEAKPDDRTQPEVMESNVVHIADKAVAHEKKPKPKKKMAIDKKILGKELEFLLQTKSVV